MELNLNNIAKKIEQSDFVKNFIKELSYTLESLNNQNNNNNYNNMINKKNLTNYEKVDYKGEIMDDIKLTQEEDLKLYRKKLEFLEDFFSKELTDLSKGEIFIVTNKYENDIEYHRYKVTQYKEHMECKYIAFEKDLPENVRLGDIVRKIDGKYIYDEIATKYVTETIRMFKEEILRDRKG